MIVARRVALIGGGLLVVWFALLVILGVTLSGRQERHTRERLAESLQSTVTLGDLDLALVRGHMTIDALSIRRDDAVGHLAIDVGGVRCELAPLGLALFDRACRELYIRALRLEVSTSALFKIKRPHKNPPIHADHMTIENATLVFLPSAVAPTLGRIELTIEHAVAGSTVLRTPISWLFSLQELRAHIALPAGITVHIGYKGGILTAAGSLFGASPVELPIQLPVADTAKDAHDEMKLLVQLGRQVAEQLVAKRAEDWLKSKLAP
jgi:hypothetical protein